MWSRNHAYRKFREPTLGRTIPFAKLSEFRTREVTPLVLIFLLQVNKTDTCVLWFSVKKQNLKKIFSCFCGNKFSDVIKIQKFDSCQNKKCRSSFYLTYDTTLHTIKETTQDTLDDSTRILHQATTSCQSSLCSPLDNVSYLRGVVEGPGRSISIKKTTKPWVKHSVSKHKNWKI